MFSRPWAFGLLLGFELARWLHLILSQRALYADGSAYLVWILERGYPLDFLWPRYFAHIVYFSPTLFAAKHLNITDIDLLSYVFGGTIFGHGGLSLVFSYLIVRKSRPWLVVFPVFSYFFITQSTMMFSISEYYLSFSLFWPLLFWLKLAPPGRSWTWLPVTAAAVVSLRTYESFLVLGPVLAFFSLLRAHRAWKRRDRLEFYWMLILALIFVAAALIAGAWFLHPYNPKALRAIQDMFQYRVISPAMVASFLGLGILIAWIFLTQALQKKLSGAWLLACTAVSAFLLATPWLRPEWVDPKEAYTHRAWGFFLSLPWIATFLALTRDRFEMPLPQWKPAWVGALILMIGSVGYDFQLTLAWERYRSRICRTLSERSGILLHSTAISEINRYDADPLASKMGWGWNWPFLSVLWSPRDEASGKHRVRALISNPQHPPWLRFDPLKRSTYPDLSRYGVEYDWENLSGKSD